MGWTGSIRCKTACYCGSQRFDFQNSVGGFLTARCDNDHEQGVTIPPGHNEFPNAKEARAAFDGEAPLTSAAPPMQVLTSPDPGAPHMDAKTASDLMQPKKDLPSVDVVKAKMTDDLVAVLTKTLVGFELEPGNKRAQKILFEAFVAVGAQAAEATGMSSRSRFKYAAMGVARGTVVVPAAPAVEELEPADYAEGDDAADDNDDSDNDE
jgi:hypothetical protein